MNVLERIAAAFAAATPEGGDPEAFAAAVRADDRPQVRRLPGQRLHGAGQGPEARTRASWPPRSPTRSTWSRWPARPRSPARGSSTSGSTTPGSRETLGDLLADDRLGIAPPDDAADGRDRLLLAQRRQADARRPHPLDGHRRQPGADLRRPSGIGSSATTTWATGARSSA